MLNPDFYSEEELALLNPAYTGFILYSSLSEFSSYKDEGMHCALPFIVIPMVMNKLISDSLPSTFKTPVGAWVASTEGALSILHEQVESFIPVVKSSISYLIDRKLISITDSGCFLLTQHALVKDPALFNKSEDMKVALRASRFLGKWFSHAPSVETIYAQLGLRP